LILFSISAIASARLAKLTGGELIVFLAISIVVYIPGVPNSSAISCIASMAAWIGCKTMALLFSISI
jgi:hypothetical protein